MLIYKGLGLFANNLVCLHLSGLVANNLVSFALNVVLRPSLFAVNVVSKLACLQFEAFMFAVRYK
ncbi:hypothetical protein NIES4101_26050 (plasmid) [Calothrix sp. NIES-4101]|nr:hypothetical protein NIES4101_26050 [Calothrix sp. NIES-4101]